jgi:hypothetical protein
MVGTAGQILFPGRTRRISSDAAAEFRTPCDMNGGTADVPAAADEDGMACAGETAGAMLSAADPARGGCATVLELSSQFSISTLTLLSFPLSEGFDDQAVRPLTRSMTAT